MHDEKPSKERAEAKSIKHIAGIKHKAEVEGR